MKQASPVVLAITALLVALATWAGLDLGALTGAPSEPPPVRTAPQPEPAPQPPREPPREPSREPSRNKAPPAVAPGAFDYYVLALSWSPTFCATEATKRDRLQCEGDRPYAFIVHGLWPQNENGYPEDCPTETPRVPDALVDDLLDIMPSRGLIGHQWRKHGACSGLGQEDFFAALRAAYDSVAIPDRFHLPETALSLPPRQIVSEFVRANPGLTPASITVTCGGRSHLDEVRICLTKDMRPRECGRQTARAQCRRDTVIMPPVRSAP